MYMYICMYAYICTCVYICIYICICTYIYVCTCIYIGEPKLLRKTFFIEQTFRIIYVYHQCIKTYLNHRIHIQIIILNKTFTLYRKINRKISKKKP